MQVLVGRWLRQPTDEELCAGYFCLLEVAEASGWWIPVGVTMLPRKAPRG
ncbi:hypothetical protein [Hymenobacter terrenus]|nr:hypothetical protein [Hymenobacter terrenus]